jgi:hypothetical protein
MGTTVRAVGLWMCVAWAMLSGGCGCSDRAVAYTVVVSDLRGAGTGKVEPLEVDLAGVSDAVASRLSGESVGDYFGGGNPAREGLDRVTLKLDGSSETYEIAASDERWARWLAAGATRLVVLAFVPGAAGDDQRRLELPLNGCEWEGRRLDIVVEPSGLRCTTSAREQDE